MVFRAGSFLSYYLVFFGDRCHLFVDLLPDDSADDHESLDARFKTPEDYFDDVGHYKHVCWCHPELIYADDIRSNQVWLHKRIQ